ncbi:proline--tRNA ligase [Corynebacterium heidelbergense]|uniref:Proline--tRNA ligase n=1 Tax=Corynebacterium heidelbergense TaxID=2055947 RepID=A0A364V5U7_9CORY|nr:proline--tRNA ligase [Corynebacterium heidelbergense]RAV32015.1 proline--tRNA ligase [Corynebacterium heidelbergense]
MITRMSSLFLRTLRDDPADAEVPSHKLLVRAGYVRRVAPGVYSWLPLGLRVLNKVENVVRREMNAIGAQELSFPALLPKEHYETTGRWEDYGDALFRLKDRKGGDYVLGPTHEELFTSTVKAECSSYKDFPIILYQIQTKYRDEERPRAGILRGREFVMKDSYSFNMVDEGLEESYQLHRGAYRRIFDTLGVEYVICAATSGAMGGSASEEFLAIADNGEDTFVRSTESDYAANVEAVVTHPPAALPITGQAEATEHHTPDCTTIEALVEWANREGIAVRGRDVTAADTLKCVIVRITEPGTDDEGNPHRPTLAGVLVPGNREVAMKRLEAALVPATVELADDKDFARNPFLVKGYVGPRALAEHGLQVLADPHVFEGSAWITGADKPEHHMVGMVAGRDFTPDRVVEAAEVLEGDPAPDGKGTLTLARGIEIGHIFQLGRKYTEAFEVYIPDESGKRTVPTMGSYGIGVSRLVAVLAEQMHDEVGLRWPATVAPYDVHVVIANKDEAATTAASELVEKLSDAGLDVLYDDRPKVSPGVKFKDSELLGMPLIVVVGRGFSERKVELRNRFTGEKLDVAYEEAVATVQKALQEL